MPQKRNFYFLLATIAITVATVPSNAGVSVEDATFIADKASEICGGKGGSLSAVKLEGRGELGVRWRLLGVAGVEGDVIVTDEEWKGIQRVRSGDELENAVSTRECTADVIQILLRNISDPAESPERSGDGALRFPALRGIEKITFECAKSEYCGFLDVRAALADTVARMNLRARPKQESGTHWTLAYGVSTKVRDSTLRTLMKVPVCIPLGFIGIGVFPTTPPTCRNVDLRVSLNAFDSRSGRSHEFSVIQAIDHGWHAFPERSLDTDAARLAFRNGAYRVTRLMLNDLGE